MRPALISAEARESVKKYLLSLNFNSLQGFSFGVDSIKSLILTCAVTEQRLSVDEGVRLARLEVEVQVKIL